MSCFNGWFFLRYNRLGTLNTRILRVFFCYDRLSNPSCTWILSNQNIFCVFGTIAKLNSENSAHSHLWRFYSRVGITKPLVHNSLGEAIANPQLGEGNFRSHRNLRLTFSRSKGFRFVFWHGRHQEKISWYIFWFRQNEDICNCFGSMFGKLLPRRRQPSRDEISFASNSKGQRKLFEGIQAHLIWPQCWRLVYHSPTFSVHRYL